MPSLGSMRPWLSGASLRACARHGRLICWTLSGHCHGWGETSHIAECTLQRGSERTDDQCQAMHKYSQAPNETRKRLVLCAAHYRRRLSRMQLPAC